jgi:hypothetical protein
MKTVRIACVPVEIRTERLPDTNLDLRLRDPASCSAGVIVITMYYTTDSQPVLTPVIETSSF